MTTTTLPLNGTKTHPLTPHARRALAELKERPRPRQDFNPGVSNRLERGLLVETVQMPSPFKVHKGANISHLKITDAGLAELEAKS